MAGSFKESTKLKIGSFDFGKEKRLPSGYEFKKYYLCL